MAVALLCASVLFRGSVSAVPVPGFISAPAMASGMSGLFDRMFLLLPAQATTNYSVRGLLPQL